MNGEMISQVLAIVGGLTILVNIITEVMKNVIPALSSSKNINVFVVALSEVLTLISGIAYFSTKGAGVDWIMVIAMIVVGFLVAYAAMFGYDKLISYFKGIKEKKND